MKRIAFFLCVAMVALLLFSCASGPRVNGSLIPTHIEISTPLNLTATLKGVDLTTFTLKEEKDSYLLYVKPETKETMLLYVDDTTDGKILGGQYTNVNYMVTFVKDYRVALVGTFSAEGYRTGDLSALTDTTAVEYHYNDEQILRYVLLVNYCAKISKNKTKTIYSLYNAAGDLVCIREETKAPGEESKNVFYDASFARISPELWRTYRDALQ